MLAGVVRAGGCLECKSYVPCMSSPFSRGEMTVVFFLSLCDQSYAQ